MKLKEYVFLQFTTNSMKRISEFQKITYNEDIINEVSLEQISLRFPHTM